jgi:serine/threonine-protein kinase
LADGTSDRVHAAWCASCTETRPDDALSRQLRVTDTDLIAKNWRRRPCPGGEAPVALKLLSTRFRVRPEYQARFRAEIAALKALDHANIVRLLDHRSDGSVDMLVMEYVEGKSVRDELTDDRERVTGIALTVAIAVCEALIHAHERGIVHRDIKPSNVMLTKHGGVKVLDFGITKLVHGEEGLTGTGDVLGSIGYLAPEIRSGSGSIDHRADVFSLGVTLHEMLNGRRPKVVDGRVVVGETPYKQIIERATHSDPDHRLSSCRELLLALSDQKASASDQT